MRVRVLAMVGLLVLGGCSNGDDGRSSPFDGRNPLAPASPEEIEKAVEGFRPGAVADHAERSAVDSLTAERRGALDPSAALLAGLLPSPDGLGDFRLAYLETDDPNGDGRIGDAWYPPRVLRQECSAKVDSAPMPVAAAVYVPGAGELGDSGPMAAFDAMSAAVAVRVQVHVFDDADQRDGYLDVSVSFYRDPTFDCGGGEMSTQTFRETAVRTTQGAAAVFEPETDIFGGGITALLPVGDRVLLVVAVSSDAVDAPWSEEDLDRWLAPVVEVALARLDSAELP